MEKVFGNYFSAKNKNKKIKFFYCKKIFSENLFVRKIFLAHNHRRVIEVEELCSKRGNHEAVVLR